MVGITWNRRGINVEKVGGERGGMKGGGEGEGRKGWYPIPCHWSLGTAGQERPQGSCVPLAGIQDQGLRCWHMPAHDCSSLGAKNTYHPMYNLVLQQRGSTERTTGWSWARHSRGEMGRTGMAGAERKRREGKQQKKECQEGGG